VLASGCGQRFGCVWGFFVCVLAFLVVFGCWFFWGLPVFFLFVVFFYSWGVCFVVCFVFLLFFFFVCFFFFLYCVVADRCRLVLSPAPVAHENFPPLKILSEVFTLRHRFCDKASSAATRAALLRSGAPVGRGPLLAFPPLCPSFPPPENSPLSFCLRASPLLAF